MAAAPESIITRAARATGFGCVLLLLVSLNIGCVDLSKPAALAHPGGSTAGAPGGGKTSTGSGGDNPDANGTGGTAGTSGAGDGGSSGTGTTDPAGGASGGATEDAGVGGSSGTSSGALDAQGAGGNSEPDAPSADRPDTDAGAGGTGGSAGRTGSSSTGTKPDAGKGGTGGTGGGTAGAGGTAGKDGGAADVRDAAAPDTALPDTAPPDAPCALCAIGATLVHRYSFGGSGTTVTDSVGTANGTVKNASLSGSGTVVLAGGTSDQYVDLPDHIFSVLTSATLELWVTWTGSGNNNQRILDFGSSKQNGSSTTAVTTVIISPNSYIDNAARLRTSYNNDTSKTDNDIAADATSTLAANSMHQIVAVFDAQSHTLSMYLNGALVNQATGLGTLAQIDDVNNYLGKSQYSGDPGFAGTYHEFRIYNAALTAAQVQALNTAGTNANFSQ